MIDFAPYRGRWKLEPFAHQYLGIEALVTKPMFFLADEMGAGKSLQVICAAQILYEQKQIDRVVVVTPASVRSVWFDPELGELAKHLFLPSLVSEYHSNIRKWGDETGLRWVVTNYEFIRDEERLLLLIKHCSEKTMLVLDESSAVKNRTAVQTKACLKLRKRCGRIVLLNGTPIANSPLDIYSQADIMDGGLHKQGILGVDSFYHFRARYGVLKTMKFPGRDSFQQIIDWQNLDDLQRRMAPYVLRRLKKECLDLPPKLDPVVLTATLSSATWKLYAAMRDDLVAWLSQQTASLAPHAVTKVMRLAQITSGFIGGVEEILTDSDELPEEKTVQEIGREKLDVFLDWLESRLAEDPNIKVYVLSRFRPEVLRLVSEVKGVEVGALMGGQKKVDRERALRLLDPRTAPKGPVMLAAVLGTGSKGLNLTASHTVIRLSNGNSLEQRLQSDDRVHRPGQTEAVSYFDIVAVGPKGQKTIDHGILVRLLKKHETSELVTSGWVSNPREWIDILTAE